MVDHKTNIWEKKGQILWMIIEGIVPEIEVDEIYCHFKLSLNFFGKGCVEFC